MLGASNTFRTRKPFKREMQYGSVLRAAGRARRLASAIEGEIQVRAPSQNKNKSLLMVVKVHLSNTVEFCYFSGTTTNLTKYIKFRFDAFRNKT